MAANSSVSLVSLDPDTNKQDFIAFLQSQTFLKDANFVGSNMNVLLDVLSHNTYKNAFYLNMVATELYLDSAQLRDSVVSRAKELNYTPASSVSAVASVNVQLATSGISILEIPKATQFSGVNSNGSFSFVTAENVILQSPNNFFSANLQIFEGLYINDTFAVDYTVNNQRFLLSNQNVDASSINVVLNENVGANQTIFTQALNLFGLNSNSKIFFVQAAENNQYEIVFGDNVFGYYPLNGSLVTVNYRVCNADAPNGVNTFLLNQDLGTINGGTVLTNTITTISPATGGAPIEPLETIRFRAPRYYQTQDNAITAPDYEEMIIQQFPNVLDVNVYGGGVTNTAVSFGKVFIVAVSTTGDPLTTTEKNNILQFLQNKIVFGITPQIIDPTDLFLEVTSTVNVDFTQTALTPPQYLTLVTTNIVNYDTQNLERFDTTFRYSKFTEMINDLDPAILSNETVITMKKIIPVTLNSNNAIAFSFNNPLEEGSLTSSQFVSNGNIASITDSSGTLVLNLASGANTNVGSVNYDTGNIVLTNLLVNALINTQGLEFKVSPQNQDIAALQTDILKIDTATMNIDIASGS